MEFSLSFTHHKKVHHYFLFLFLDASSPLPAGDTELDVPSVRRITCLLRRRGRRCRCMALGRALRGGACIRFNKIDPIVPRY